MATVYVCPLSQVDRIARESRAGWMLTLATAGHASARPEGVPAERHLTLTLSDIAAPLAGHVLPAQTHVRDMIGFAQRWDRGAPLLIHCYAGVSRSTAAAFVIACAMRPKQPEAEIANEIRRLSPTATPNPRIVALGDLELGRNGRMIAAIAALGRGAECFEGVPFRLEID